MPDRRATGRHAEAAAAAFLEAQGYTILTSNYRSPYGEVDIIAQQGDTLVFVEVRAKRSLAFGTPQESLTPAKRQHLIATAQHYLQEHNLSSPWRIDLVTVEFPQRGRPLLTLYRNAITGDEPPTPP